MPDEDNNVDTRIEHTCTYMLRLTTETGGRLYGEPVSRPESPDELRRIILNCIGKKHKKE